MEKKHVEEAKVMNVTDGNETVTAGEEVKPGTGAYILLLFHHPPTHHHKLFEGF